MVGCVSQSKRKAREPGFTGNGGVSVSARFSHDPPIEASTEWFVTRAQLEVVCSNLIAERVTVVLRVLLSSSTKSTDPVRQDG